MDKTKINGNVWHILLRSDEYKKWKRTVRKNFKYTCIKCGQNRYNKRNRLHCHHIKPKSLFTTELFVVENGVLLCSECHIQEHKDMRILHPEYSDMPVASENYIKILIKSLHFKEYNRRRYSRRKVRK